MSLLNVKPGPLKDTILVPRSKSHANRLLILACMATQDVVIESIPESSDVLSLINCLKKIGIIIHKSEKSVSVIGSFPACEVSSNEVIEIETGDGGTTTRFITALLARGENHYKIIPHGHMKNRPVQPLVDGLKNLGVQVNKDDENYLILRGPYFDKGSATIDCQDSTQFLSAIMMATVDKEITLKELNLTSSAKYLEITKTMVQKFKNDNLLYHVPVDASSLGYPLAFAALDDQNREVLVGNCFAIDEEQADSKIFNILEQIGANVEFSSLGLRCSKNELRPFIIDGSECPDLIPTLCFLASYLKGKSYLNNIGVLRHKESDRIEEIIHLLNIFRVNFEFEHDNLIIFGRSEEFVDKPEIYTAPDHRIIMMAYLFLKQESGGLLNHITHVKKSFPHFTSLFKS
jgi:3-phosphoshikimate 1-carboxyvinyltransferase